MASSGLFDTITFGDNRGNPYSLKATSYMGYNLYMYKRDHNDENMIVSAYVLRNFNILRQT